MRRLSILCLIAMILDPAVMAAAAVPESFTVKTSVEMTTFSDPDQLSRVPTAKFSPDGEYFIVVTSSGSVTTNKITSSIRLFRTRDVRALLRGSGAMPTGGEVLTTSSAVPVTTALQAYAPVASDVRWTTDSKAILYLGQSANGERRLHRVTIWGHDDVVLTPVGYDVQSFDITPDKVVFAASDTAAIEAIAKSAPGVEVTANARNVTGVPLWTILGINSDRGFIERTKPVFRLGSISLGSVGVARDRAVPPTFSSLQYASMWGVLAISPNGGAAIELLAADKFSPAWSHYKIGFPGLNIVCDGKRLEAPTGVCATRQYSIVDLMSGRRTALFDAPFGSTFGYADIPMAKWSADGRRVLVTGTFLPTSASRSDDPNLGLCDAAVFDVTSHATACLRYSDYRRDMDDADPKKLVLYDADLSASGDEARLIFTQGRLGITSTEHYRRERGSWKRADPSTRVGNPSVENDRRGAASGPISIWIKQDLDEPPQLWATDVASGASAKLWDPNPHLKAVQIGHAAVFRWKDPSGHEWIGGLVKPVGYVPGRRYPLVIQTYTFAQHQFLSDGMDTTAEAAMPLASAGIVVLQIQKRFDQNLTDQEAAIQIPGFEAAVSQLAAEGLIDPKKVGIIGFSRGAYYTVAALIAKPGLFAAATVADGLDQSYMQHRLFEVAALQDKSTYGSTPDGAGLEKWLMLAPGFNLDKVRTPLHVEAIGPLSVLQEWELYASLREQKKPVDFLYFPDGQHILRKPSERMASQQGNVDWFRFWLQDYEDSDPAKVDQYLRWRELRKMRDLKPGIESTE